jgi:signal transduction histidine kinase
VATETERQRKISDGTESAWSRTEVDALLRVSRAVALEADLPGLLDILAEEARMVTRSDSASILLNEPNGGFALGASKGLSDGYKRFLQGHFISFGRSVSRLAVDELEPLVVDDVATHPIFARTDSPELLRFAAKEGYRSMVAVPMIAGARNLGVLNLYRNQPSDWSKSEIELTLIFSQHAASAIDSASLIDSQRRQVEALERLVTVLRDQTHEYANRLHALSGLLALGETREAQRFLSQLMAVHHENYSSVIDRVHDPILAALLVAQMGVGRQRGVDVRLHRSSHVEVLPERLGRPEMVTILANLIQNAIEATVSLPGGRRRVSVRITQAPASLSVTVRDWGDGIQPDAVERMFGRGESGKDGHPGIGLALVSDAVAAANGTVTVRHGRPGTTFKVLLPLT